MLQPHPLRQFLGGAWCPVCLLAHPTDGSRLLPELLAQFLSDAINALQRFRLRLMPWRFSMPDKTEFQSIASKATNACASVGFCAMYWSVTVRSKQAPKQFQRAPVPVLRTERHNVVEIRHECRLDCGRKDGYGEEQEDELEHRSTVVTRRNAVERRATLCAHAAEFAVGQVLATHR